MRELISYAAALVFYGFGLGVLQVPNPKRVVASRVFFLLGAISASGATIMWGVNLSDNILVRFILCFCVFGLIGAGTVEAIRFAGHTQQIEPPSVAPTPTASLPPPLPTQAMPTSQAASSPRHLYPLHMPLGSSAKGQGVTTQKIYYSEEKRDQVVNEI